jgi:hypothetical protein
MTNLQFYLEEAKGNVDYQGYIFPRWRGESVSQVLVFSLGIVSYFDMGRHLHWIFR